MRRYRIVGPALSLGLLLAVGLAVGFARAGNGATVPVPHYHTVPCTPTPPDAVTTTWHIVRPGVDPNTGQAGGQLMTGQRTTRNHSVVAQLYREVCGTTLIKYDHPVAIVCPSAMGSASYHLLFSARSRVVLGVTETDLGCQFLWIDGHRDLGYGFEVLFLPPGAPSLYPAT